MSAGPRLPKQLRLQILLPEQMLYEGQVLWVQVPLEDGFIGIWPGHAPLVGSIGQGCLQWDAGQGAQELEIDSGMLRVDIDRCVILVGRSGAEVPRPRAAQTEALFEGLAEALSDSLSDEEFRDLQGE